MGYQGIHILDTQCVLRTHWAWSLQAGVMSFFLILFLN